MSDKKEVAKVPEKKDWMGLKNSVDCEKWFERIANEVTQDQHSIAQANTRNGCVKGRIALEKLRLDYERMARHGGGKNVELSRFLA